MTVRDLFARALETNPVNGDVYACIWYMMFFKSAWQTEKKHLCLRLDHACPDQSSQTVCMPNGTVLTHVRVGLMALQYGSDLNQRHYMVPTLLRTHETLPHAWHQLGHVALWATASASSASKMFGTLLMGLDRLYSAGVVGASGVHNSVYEDLLESWTAADTLTLSQCDADD
jgi:hypothetical protein